MNKFIISIAMLFLFISFTFFSCSKYEDGPQFTLRSKTSRLTNEWKVDKVYKNGIEQALSGSYSGISWSVFLEMEIKNDETVKFYGGDIDNGYVQAGTNEGKWEWADDKEAITFTLTSKMIVYFMNISANTAETYTIKRLAHDELWIESIPQSANDAKYEMHFIPK